MWTMWKMWKRCGRCRALSLAGRCFQGAAYRKKISTSRMLFMHRKMWILWISLFSEQLFAYFIDISGSHSYQQITGLTIL